MEHLRIDHRAVQRMTLTGRQHTHLKPIGHPSLRQTRPIRLGWSFLLFLVAGLVVIGVWTAMHLGPGADVLGVVSFGVSAAATLVVSLLATVALINFVSSITHSPYLWILPSNFAKIRLDWPIAVAVAGGILLGWRFWQ